MTDYTHGTGSGGTMTIRDDGSNLELLIQSGSSSTYVGSLSWSWHASWGGSGSGSHEYPTGAPVVSLATVSATTTQDFTFHIDGTGTSGIGGPTDFTVHIDRGPPDTVPSPPQFLYFSEVTFNSFKLNFSAPANDGGAGVDGYLVRLYTGSDPTPQEVPVSASPLFVPGASPGVLYGFTVLAHNSIGYSAPSPLVQGYALSGAHVKYLGEWRQAILYAKYEGVWRATIPYVKYQGVWHQCV